MAKQKPSYSTLADFQAANDPRVRIPAKIKAGLASLLLEGKESAEFESEFCKRSDVSITYIGKFRETFAAHIVQTRPEGRGSIKHVWFADPKTAAKARG